MSRADIVVGVLGTGTSSDNVLFELGFAQAMNKRTLVLVSGDAPSRPGHRPASPMCGPI